VYSPDLLLTMYRKMMLARRFEEKAGQAYGLKKIQGFCHLYIGQEAVVVGVNEALRPTDQVMTAYRDHVHPLVRGADAGMLMAELYGKDTGYSKGKGGSMHLFDIEHNFYGGYGIVGGQIPLAAGMAFASKYRGEDKVTVCSFGDAASNQGALHETFNMAAKWKLPVLYIVENNKYGMGTDVSRVTAEPDLYKRAASYRMRGEQVDGMDVLKVYETAKDIVEHVRKGNGPALLEVLTYRFRGHSMSDAATYRTKDEVEEEKGRDPILTLRAYITKNKLAPEAQFDAIDEDVKHEIEQAMVFADQSAEPPLEDVWKHTWVAEGEPDEKPRQRVRGVEVTWPSHPTQFEVKWDLEPKEAPVPAVQQKKGAA
jgi:pyruvate dehydrogenase E1 component alpha subunit